MKIDKCKEIIYQYFGESVSIHEIGNHDLGRHFVFKVTKGKPYVMKFYFKEHKWEREVSALRILNSEQLKIPTIIDSGITNGVEWLLYEYIEGSNLGVLDLTNKDLISVYHSLGIEVAKIHKENKYKKFGRLNINGDFYIVNETNKEYLQYIFNSTVKNLKSFNHRRGDLIKQSIQSFEEKLQELDEVHDGYLCHNDISDRNILVHNKKFELLYDFEQSSIIDRYLELAIIKHHLVSKDKCYFTAFIDGYKEILNLNMSTLEKRERTYILLHGLMICSWTLDINKDYYNEGIRILEQYSEN